MHLPQREQARGLRMSMGKALGLVDESRTKKRQLSPWEDGQQPKTRQSIDPALHSQPCSFLLVFQGFQRWWRTAPLRTRPEGRKEISLFRLLSGGLGLQHWTEGELVQMWLQPIPSAHLKEGSITFSLLSGGLGLQHWTENDNISELNISWEVSWFSQRRVEHGNFIDILTWGWAGPDVTNHLRPDQQPPSGLLWPNEHFSTA